MMRSEHDCTGSGARHRCCQSSWHDPSIFTRALPSPVAEREQRNGQLLTTCHHDVSRTAERLRRDCPLLEQEICCVVQSRCDTSVICGAFAPRRSHSVHMSNSYLPQTDTPGLELPTLRPESEQSAHWTGFESRDDRLWMGMEHFDT